MTTSPETTKERRRKSVYTDKLGERVCRAIATSTIGIARMVAADKTLPSESTIYLWIQLNPRFADAYAAARKEQANARMEAAQEVLETTKVEVRALIAEKTKDAREEAKILITMMKAEMAMQYRLAAWLAPRTSAGTVKDDDEDLWNGKKFYPPEIVDPDSWFNPDYKKP